MSTVICEKQFTLQVVGIRPPTNYWKLQSIGGGTTPASVGTKVLNVGTNWTTEAGGIIGPTCFKGNDYAGPSQSMRSNIGDFIFKNLATGFTLRWWVKCDQPSPSGEDITDLLIIDGKISGGVVSDFDVQANGIPNPQIGVELYDVNTFAAVDATSTYPIDSNWHRGVAIVDKVNKLIKWKLDNNPTVTTTHPAGFYFSLDTRQLCFLGLGLSVNRHLSMSEVGLWQEILLSESELLVDWNNGSGLSFP